MNHQPIVPDDDIAAIGRQVRSLIAASRSVHRALREPHGAAWGSRAVAVLCEAVLMHVQALSGHDAPASARLGAAPSGGGREWEIHLGRLLLAAEAMADACLRGEFDESADGQDRLARRVYRLGRRCRLLLQARCH